MLTLKTQKIDFFRQVIKKIALLIVYIYKDILNSFFFVGQKMMIGRERAKAPSQFKSQKNKKNKNN